MMSVNDKSHPSACCLSWRIREICLDAKYVADVIYSDQECATRRVKECGEGFGNFFVEFFPDLFLRLARCHLLELWWNWAVGVMKRRLELGARALACCDKGLQIGGIADPVQQL